MGFRFLAISLLAAFLGVVWPAAASASQQFEEANKLYEQGKFADAARAYEGLLSGGRSAELFFNLGNAWFKAGQTGKAILNYRRAELLAPRDADIQANLRFARETVLGPKARNTLWARFKNSLTHNELAALSVIAMWLWFGLLTAGVLRPALRDSLRRYAQISGALAIGLAVWLGAQIQDRYGKRAAVVTIPEAVARYGPLEESQTAFTLRDGSEIRIAGHKSEWMEIEDSSGRKGWVQGKAVTPLREDARK